MNVRAPLSRLVLSAAVLCLSGLSGGCRKPTQVASKSAPVTPVTLDSNGLGGLPGALYQSQAASPIHWQPWTPETMARAKAMNRLVFALVVMPQFPGWQQAIQALEQDKAVLAAINDHYVPVLIDADASREMGLLALDLCSEIKRPLDLPLFVWMTPAGNPVAWVPVKTSPMEDVVSLFNQSDTMVYATWQEDQQNQKSYVLETSAADNVARQSRLGKRVINREVSPEPAQGLTRSLRQLVSLYDPATRSLDETGGLFPAGAISLLATAAIQPGISPELRASCLGMTRELMIDLQTSAMFDPLDGGLFTSRQGSWCLPSFSLDCVSQARALIALTDAYRATGDAMTLEKARGVISSVERNFGTTEGLFAVGIGKQVKVANWLWSIEDVEKELPPEDAKWWIQATQMKSMGNFPPEVDPQREHFRKNSIALGKSADQLAQDLRQPVAEFLPRFEAVRQKLLAARNKRMGPATRDDCSHAGASFRMVSAYAAMFGITGEAVFRDKAVSLLEKSQRAFSDGPRLRIFSKDAPKSLGTARAFIYSLAIQAGLDVSSITSDEKFMTWTEDLATTTAELFTAPDTLKECPDEAKITDVPVMDLSMLYDDSTAGLLSLAECRFAERGRPLVPALGALVSPLPLAATQYPTLYTDILQATLARELKVTLVTGEGLSPELRRAVERLPLRTFQHRAARPGETVPTGSVEIRRSGGEKRVISTVQALQQAVLP